MLGHSPGGRNWAHQWLFVKLHKSNKLGLQLTKFLGNWLTLLLLQSCWQALFPCTVFPVWNSCPFTVVDWRTFKLKKALGESTNACPQRCFRRRAVFGDKHFVSVILCLSTMYIYETYCHGFVLFRSIISYCVSCRSQYERVYFVIGVSYWAFPKQTVSYHNLFLPANCRYPRNSRFRS